jgi:hypothetical protein
VCITETYIFLTLSPQGVYRRRARQFAEMSGHFESKQVSDVISFQPLKSSLLLLSCAAVKAKDSRLISLLKAGCKRLDVQLNRWVHRPIDDFKERRRDKLSRQIDRSLSVIGVDAW